MIASLQSVQLPPLVSKKQTRDDVAEKNNRTQLAAFFRGHLSPSNEFRLPAWKFILRLKLKSTK